MLALYKTEADMQAIPHGVAHLIHGSSEGRFTIPLCAGPSIGRRRSSRSATSMPTLSETQRRYDPAKMKEGWNTMPDGEEGLLHLHAERRPVGHQCQAEQPGAA